MNNTFSDMMTEYERVREGARCHSAWDPLNKFVEDLIRQLTTNKIERLKLSDFRPPVIAPAEEPSQKFSQYSFDSEGTPIHHGDD